ncbi:hypothetical protein BV360_02746 [Pseudomonas syringae pv. actinidiae]|nr:hypothetical protein BV340_03111 [Pseudomonas syringae pv. actinidiae]OSN18008.1 hypothetical protein BV339_03257 [Pseudomonas syringae pv. actinidiae]OSN25749.1 hypothetical protein BV341_03106 [Pseudomonas syringae pv. actinidiae]OSN33414.1 hypothetical protein BV343_03114 [Pseudomonas syringae pv. actinidiae]OSN34426.1 hypothetical protein BV342_03236 [Pseudomonas syringae pv. actinidiae]
MTRLDAHRVKPHPVASFQLPQLPQVRFDDGYRAHEAAQARAVRAEDDRHVTGKIHRANGIRVVVDVGRMQTRLTTVRADPFRLGADQAHAGAAGVEMHLPVGGKERFDIGFGEVFRRGVRAVDHSNLANLFQCIKLFISHSLARTAVNQRLDMQHVTCA